MDASHQARAQRRKELLNELAELMIEEQVEEGVFLETPHFSIIEAAAVNLGNQLSRKAQERAAGEIAANCTSAVPCLTCESECRVTSRKREVASTSGVLDMIESMAYCHKCRRFFFPQRVAMGMDSREVTPKLASAVVHLAGEIRSFERAEKTTEAVLALKVSRSTIRRLAKQVGLELAELEEADELNADKDVLVPDVAVVSCDGGRIRTRETENGRGVQLTGENGWKEDKIASFERMSQNEQHINGEDSCPTLPTSFQTAEKVARITEKPVPEVSQPSDQEQARVVYEGPKRILRTTIGSMANSDEFGRKMQREARRRRLPEARKRAFIADGLNWNWTIWKRHFSTFVPILDFIHAIQYVFAASNALHKNEGEAWTAYTRFITQCWTGKVAKIIDELTSACEALGIDLNEDVRIDDPHKPITDAIRYLTNNQSKMDYPSYRRQGLPVTSAPMESLVKQINLRVKGTEMFWDDPDGAEAILQLRAAALSDDGRLTNYLNKRPGCPFVRRATEANLAT